MYVGLHVRCMLLLSDFNKIWIKNLVKVPSVKSYENRPVGVQLYVYGQTWPNKVMQGKVKFTLEQGMQVERYSSTLSVIWEVDGGWVVNATPRRITHGNDLVPVVLEAGLAPQPSGRMRRITL